MLETAVADRLVKPVVHDNGAWEKPPKAGLTVDVKEHIAPYGHLRSITSVEDFLTTAKSAIQPSHPQEQI